MVIEKYNNDDMIIIDRSYEEKEDETLAGFTLICIGIEMDSFRDNLTNLL